MASIYEELSAERKAMQAAGVMPQWFTTAGWQLFKDRYLYEAKNPLEQYTRIAKAAAAHLTTVPCPRGSWEERFIDLFVSGYLSLSTPVLANMGTNRGLPVSCSGQYIPDSIDGIYAALRETAILTKHGFGTSGYLGVRPRGASISVGGKATGVLPVFESFVSATGYVKQGTARRGAWAGYIEIDHPDTPELMTHIENYPEDANIGWIITDAFIEKLNKGDQESVAVFQKAMKMKMVTGKGYFFFQDKANRKRPQMYVDKDLKITASQLCSEIMLHSSEDYTYTCVLSSMNASKWDEWKDTDAVFYATVFLDCVAGEFIKRGSEISGLEKAVAFTEKSRALGLGVCGLHTLYQMKGLPFASFEAHMLNNEVFEQISRQAKEASQWMATHLGEPEWCKGYGVRNTHLMAVAPTKSTALIMGGVSEGINPDPAMTYTQLTAAGEVDRLNPILLELMKRKNLYTDKHVQEIVDAKGSVQGVSWLSDHEKSVFKTAFEIDQKAIIRQAAARQGRIDQGQSLNLFFSHDTPEEYIAEVHQEAFENENILALYYCYSKRGVGLANVNKAVECEACQ